MGELGYWGRDEPVTVLVQSAQTVRKAIRMWITRGAKIPQRFESGVPQIEKRTADTRQERKEEHAKRVPQVHALDKAPPEGVQRVWTDGSQQQSIDGKEYAGYGVWFGEGHALNYRALLKGEVQTIDRAEMTAAIHALEVSPRTVALQICVDSQLVTDGVTKWLEGWKRR